MLEEGGAEQPSTRETGQGPLFSGQDAGIQEDSEPQSGEVPSFSPVEDFDRESSSPTFGEGDDGEKRPAFTPSPGAPSEAGPSFRAHSDTSTPVQGFRQTSDSDYATPRGRISSADGGSFRTAVEPSVTSTIPKSNIFENDLFNESVDGGDEPTSSSLTREVSEPTIVRPAVLSVINVSSPRLRSFTSASPRPLTPSRLGMSTPRTASLAERRLERIQTSGRLDRNISPSRGSITAPGPQRVESFQASVGAQQAAVRLQQTPLNTPQATDSLRSVDSARRHQVSLSYDPHGDEHQQAVETARSMRIPKSPTAQRNVELADIAKFLHTPGPKNKPVFCYIIRDTSAAKMFPKYNLFLEDGKRFLLSSRKRKKQKSTNYLISLDFDDLGRDSDFFFAKLRANFVGTEFSVYNDGFNPGNKNPRSHNGSERKELAAVTYSPNLIGSKSPRKMMAIISKVDGSGRRLFKPTCENDTMLERVKTGNKIGDLVVMRNKLPRWNEELGAYCLNFNGRVTEASIKNFQLVTEENEDHIICQFGKIGKNTFTMDYQWPMCALQAFAICLSSMDNKLACE